jgi:hypothetical protein
MTARGAADIPANVAVWAAGLFAGALLNVLYPAYLMSRNRSWGTLARNANEIGLAIILGVMFCSAFAFMGKGMVLLGALGASVGFGVYQSTQMLGGQAVGFLGGEWRGVSSGLRVRMYAAIVTLVIASAIMSYGNAMGQE